MNTLLLVLGAALVVFGAVVLIWFSGRPGGTLKWLGLELSSSGAGLPLIALGVLCVVLGIPAGPGAREADGGGPERDPAATEEAVAAGGAGLEAGCLAEIAATVGEERVVRVEEGSRDLPVIDRSRPQTDPFVLVLTDGGEPVGALRVRRYGAELFKLEAVVDGACRPVEPLLNLSRGGDPRSLMNWDTVRLGFGERRYDLRLGGEGDTGIGYFLRAAS